LFYKGENEEKGKMSKRAIGSRIKGREIERSLSRGDKRKKKRCSSIEAVGELRGGDRCGNEKGQRDLLKGCLSRQKKRGVIGKEKQNGW